MSNLEHSQILEDAQTDFDGFMQEKDYENAEAIIAGLRETGFRSESEYLQKKIDAVWGKMSETERSEWAREQTLKKDLEVEPEDPRDINDRSGTYPY